MFQFLLAVLVVYLVYSNYDKILSYFKGEGFVNFYTKHIVQPNVKDPSDYMYTKGNSTMWELDDMYCTKCETEDVTLIHGAMCRHCGTDEHLKSVKYRDIWNGEKWVRQSVLVTTTDENVDIVVGTE